MQTSSRSLTLFGALWLACVALAAQAPSKPTVAPPESAKEYSKEAFIIEQDSSRITFQNDGTSVRESTSRIRIQSDAGVQQWGILSFPYENSTQAIEIDYVRVRKPDNSVIVTPIDGVQDMPSEISRQAPLYSDLKEKHLAVKGLSVGDVLEFQAHSRTTKPLAPGQFWYSQSFSHDGIILQQQLELRVPKNRPVKWKSQGSQPVITEDAGLRVFTWDRQQLEHKSSEQEKLDEQQTLRQAVRGQMAPPDVQLSSFQSWEEVGRWYGGLQQERVKSTPEITAKAAELTKNAPDEATRLRVIYGYVSTQFRYIGIDFGIGRYQPHAAAEVLGNQYGDCKDKHTLLASLLSAVGIKAYPALISARFEIDPDVPSPGQFDHVISVVPQSGSFVWLDTTPEVSPFAYLVSPLRGKHALLIPDDKPPSLATTPEDSPARALQTFHAKAKLSETGLLEGKIERTFEGDDYEVLFRTAFRRVPLPNWQQLAQRLSLASGFGGDVSEVTAGSPEKTDEPFRFSYTYTRKDYSDWSDRRITPPLPPITLPDLADDDKTPAHSIWFGSPAEIHLSSEVELPKGYSADVPKKFDLALSFAEYHASSSFKDGILSSDRRIIFKRRELPAADYDSYKSFSKLVTDEASVYIQIYKGGRPPVSATSYQEEIWKLPGSENAAAQAAYDEARSDFPKGDVPGEISSLQHAVELDPKFVRAWLWLGDIFKYRKEFDQAIAAYRKAIAVDPHVFVSYKALGFTFMANSKVDEALSVWQEMVKAFPEDAEARSYLGTALLALKRYPEAATVLEASAKLDPQQLGVQSLLGSAYLGSGEDDKALAAYHAALNLNPVPRAYNDAAYTMAEAGKLLPTALEYAQKAVHDAEDASTKLKLPEVHDEDLGKTASLAAFWDTLGWVYFKQGNLVLAERFCKASWLLTQRVVIAEHLRQIYEKQNKFGLAFKIRSFLSPPPVAAGKTRSGKTDPGVRLNLQNPELSNLRISIVERFAKVTSTEEILAILAWDAKSSEFKIEDWKPVSGEDKLKPSAQVLNSIHFQLTSPDNTPVHLLRRGILGCYEYTGCSLVLFEPDQVRSIR
jgi:tetratricopeptide (TPR) repeat protein